MTHLKLLYRFIILVFMGLIGFSLSNSLKAQSTVGFILAVLGLAAAIYFLHLLDRANQEANREREETV